MSKIQEYLSKIGTAVYGKDVRQSIIDAIKQCYEDAIKGVDGYTPQKGLDYFTEGDRQEIIDAIYSKVIDGNEVQF